MTQSNNRDSEGLPNLEDILLGTLNAQNEGGDEFSRLQELLVKPDILRMRQQISKLEEKFPEIVNIRDRVNKLEEELPEIAILSNRVTNLEKEVVDLESQIDEPKELIKIVLSLISELLNHKLAKLKAEILEEIVPLIQEQSQQEQTLSIRVSGINRDPE
ncbi:hypothetical protein [Limnofasciculus baicalensis]|uniref:Uncharacterized protein n=1 Tax=Limnofasciculus baicalensis BBK-W-15 TaxID=2699891 RepID=A0AAE3GS29_9CYAN|nr:hypothetical protein [Limnofasciculus baicalensis]MCP2727522.1 hypothetical protein [Limnofasciculus baicalensis BBK-W-15]